MPTAKCSVCGAPIQRTETRTVIEEPLVGPDMAYVEEKQTCVEGHTVLRLTNNSYRPAAASA